MKLYFQIFNNPLYPERKFKISKCWGYDNDYDKKGICFYVFNKILIIAYGTKQKPLKKGFIETNPSRVIYSKPKENHDNT